MSCVFPITNVRDASLEGQCTHRGEVFSREQKATPCHRCEAPVHQHLPADKRPVFTSTRDKHNPTLLTPLLRPHHHTHPCRCSSCQQNLLLLWIDYHLRGYDAQCLEDQHLLRKSHSRQQQTAYLHQSQHKHLPTTMAHDHRAQIRLVDVVP